MKAREIEDENDPYAVVVVIGTHFPTLGEEVILQPLAFGEAVSVPVAGPGRVLSIFDVLTEDEAAALRPDGPRSDFPAWISDARAEIESVRDRRDSEETVR